MDRVTPFNDGAKLAGAWRLPEANCFRLRHGHMGLATRLLLDDAPVARFADALTAL